MNKGTGLKLTASVLLAALLSSCTSVQTETTTSETSIETTAVTEETTSITTETEKSSRVPLSYTFNQHVLSDVWKQQEGFEENFYLFCDAVYNAEETVTLNTNARKKPDEYINSHTIERLYDASEVSCPIAYRFLDYDKTRDINEKSNGKTFKLAYKVSRDELLTKISEFKKRVEELITSSCSEDDTELEKTLELYIKQSKRMNYAYYRFEYFKEQHILTDKKELEEFERSIRSYAYNSIMGNSGICDDISTSLAFLYLQAGIDATTNTSLLFDKIDKAFYGHRWDIVKINGQYYQCDATWQTKNNKKLDFFGMNDERRKSSRFEYDFPVKSKDYVWGENIRYCDWDDTKLEKTPEINDNRFEDLWNADSYELDTENDLLHLTFKKYNGNTYKDISLK